MSCMYIELIVARAAGNNHLSLSLSSYPPLCVPLTLPSLSLSHPSLRLSHSFHLSLTLFVSPSHSPSLSHSQRLFASAEEEEGCQRFRADNSKHKPQVTLRPKPCD